MLRPIAKGSTSFLDHLSCIVVVGQGLGSGLERLMVSPRLGGKPVFY